ncbi:DUF2293 domain-containing protein [Planctomicrobium sp.]|jgi:hypothetical protein|nr:DUF2293 domain-containing protein [Planctomicrobium sp.]MDB4731326.1 DUF2293 domain-containing protein [bacterium]MDB4743652.1 DUF2293 domain-containing protein [Planctomicrobium sp.]
MSKQVYSPGPTNKTVRAPAGEIIPVPTGWDLLPPGDATLTRRVKKAGDHFQVQEKKGRRTFSLGVWAPSETIEEIKTELTSERSTDAYAKKKASAAKRRDKAQSEYVEDFSGAIISYLNFADEHTDLAVQIAQVVAEHATPIGSGTVARTKRIPIEQRAEAAVIAWMRHQTTGYDSMVIPRVKGKRREVRRMLAKRSKALLSKYREGQEIPVDCPLRMAIK